MRQAILFEDGSAEHKTRDRTGGDRVKDVEILFGSEEDGED